MRKKRFFCDDHSPSVLCLSALEVKSSSSSRSVSWWFDVSESQSDDQANLATIREHSNVFSSCRTLLPSITCSDGGDMMRILRRGINLYRK